MKPLQLGKIGPENGKDTAELRGKHYHVFFDNSPVQDLLADGVYACGTARTNPEAGETSYINKIKANHA